MTHEEHTTSSSYEKPFTSMTVYNNEQMVTNPQNPVGVFFHGFGADAESFSHLCRAMLAHVSYWVVPQAPVSLLDVLGQPGFGWFPESRQKLRDAVFNNYWEQIEKFEIPDLSRVAIKIIDEIVRPLTQAHPNVPIIIAGYSQGGMVVSEVIVQALERGIQISKGLIFSSCMTSVQQWTDKIERHLGKDSTSEMLSYPTLWQCHGSFDTVLLPRQGEALLNFWKQYASIELHVYDYAHEIGYQAIEDANKFLQERI